jgi:hypothetical protein
MQKPGRQQASPENPIRKQLGLQQARPEHPNGPADNRKLQNIPVQKKPPDKPANNG